MDHLILVIDDDEMNRDMIARRLELRGYRVAEAVDAAKGILMASELVPDLVLMDIHLPEMDGWEATRRLKADPATCTIPVVALTAHAMVGDRNKAIEAGCDDYATKPVDFSCLLEKMTNLLGRKTTS